MISEWFVWGYKHVLWNNNNLIKWLVLMKSTLHLSYKLKNNNWNSLAIRMDFVHGKRNTFHGS